MTTVINAYADQKTADLAIAALRKEGLSDQQARILTGDTQALVRELSEHGFEDADARAYATAVEQGQTLVIASISEEQADWALAIMDRILADHAGSAVRSVPIVEEELSVSKARSANGGVRVTSRVVETPVEETVTLTTETVGVKRHAADRVLGEDEAAAIFKEKTVEMMGTQEEVEIHKQARVVGEVEITKEVEAHQQTVKDTVRKTEVEVEEVGVRASKK